MESYVDDSKIYLAFSIRDAELAAMKLTEDMRRITAWCCLNSLLVNPEKTKMLILGTRQMLEQVPENFQITILGENITPVAVAKDLGMILDSCLSYDEHIASIVSSCIARLGQISRVKHIFDRKTLITADVFALENYERIQGRLTDFGDRIHAALKPKPKRQYRKRKPM